MTSFRLNVLQSTDGPRWKNFCEPALATTTVFCMPPARTVSGSIRQSTAPLRFVAKRSDSAVAEVGQDKMILVAARAIVSAIGWGGTVTEIETGAESVVAPELSVAMAVS